MTSRSILGSLLAALFASACGGSSSESSVNIPPAGQTVIVLTVPSEAEIEPGSTLRFSAQVTGTADTSVAWTVAEANGGTIDPTGLYTAPASEGTFHVRADSAIASVKSNGTSVVRVKRNASPRPVSVTVNPGTINLPFGGSAVFAALVTDATNVSVTWSVQEGTSCGSVSSTGTYTAPSTASTCHVIATSAADPTKSGSATVTVTAAAAPVVAISINPATATLDACKAVVFNATVTNSTNTAATWTVTEAGGGTVLNGIYTAPQTAGTYHVVARSVADTTKTVQATVTVGPEKVMSVAVTPGSGTMQASGTLAFSATVTTSCGTSVAP
jgi:hypothetical protein